MTKERMIELGFLFNDEGDGYSESLKDKWHPEEKLMSTGHYFADYNEDGSKVNFWYSNKYGAEFEREDFPE